MFFYPSGLLIVFVLAINLIGDGLRDALDPSKPAGPVARRRTDEDAAPAATATAPEPARRTRARHPRPARSSFPGADGTIVAVRGVDLALRRGEVLGLVGESGSGKSVTALATMGLLPSRARVAGSVRLDGTELIGASDDALAALRGDRISMVFQDPLAALAPFYRVGDQIAETVRIHRGLSRQRARERAVELLDLVGIPEPRRRADAFPHEFSGGMRQRAMIAMAIANDPDVILADEPTTALDVTVQAQILDVLRTARRETGAAMIFVSHDLGVVAGFADRVAVMYAGRVVETAPVDDLFARPRMPYTLGLHRRGPAGRRRRARHARAHPRRARHLGRDRRAAARSPRAARSPTTAAARRNPLLAAARRRDGAPVRLLDRPARSWRARSGPPMCIPCRRPPSPDPRKGRATNARWCCEPATWSRRSRCTRGPRSSGAPGPCTSWTAWTSTSAVARPSALVGESGCRQEHDADGDPGAARAARAARSRCSARASGELRVRRRRRQSRRDADRLPGPDGEPGPAACRSATSSPSRCARRARTGP